MNKMGLLNKKIYLNIENSIVYKLEYTNFMDNSFYPFNLHKNTKKIFKVIQYLFLKKNFDVFE